MKIRIAVVFEIDSVESGDKIVKFVEDNSTRVCYVKRSFNFLRIVEEQFEKGEDRYE